MWVAAVRQMVVAEVVRRASAQAFRGSWSVGSTWSQPPDGWPRPAAPPWAPPAHRSGGTGWAPSAAPVRPVLASTTTAAAERVRDAVAGWRHPARRFARAKRRARRALGVRSAGAAGLTWVTLTVGSVPDVEVSELAWGSAAGVVALAAFGAARRVWRLERTPAPPPALPRPGPLPPRDALARPAMERLAERQRVLAGLLDHLGPAADETRRVAADAAVALRAHATRLTAVDRARRGVAADVRAGLDTAIGVLLRQLHDGLAGYEALVAAAADAVCASASLHFADPVLARRLADATDALAGLAAGLREVAAIR